MKLRFVIEEGRTYLYVTETETDREVLDAQCEHLSLTKAETTTPLGMKRETPLSFWRDTTTSQLANMIRRTANTGTLADDINAPVYHEGSVNIGLLRLRPEAGETLRVPTGLDVAVPDDVHTIVSVIEAAYRAIVNIVWEYECDITVRKTHNGQTS